VDPTVGMIWEEFPDMTAAMVRRAKRGRVDAFKFLMEMSGIHAPRVQHQHSGQVELVLTQMPRPANTNKELNESVVDAEVVEE